MAGWASRTAAIAVAVAGAVPLRAYRTEIHAARKRIKASARVLETAAGRIEYGDAGDGPPVLMIHGAGGGFDQGLWAFRDAVPDAERAYRVIAPSRFGYLGSPLPRDASPSAQAAAFAALLDALRVERVAVVGLSAGALSAMQFAIQYPDRTTCLVLEVPGAWTPPAERPSTTLMANPFIKSVAFKSDFVMWAFNKLAPASLEKFLGVPPALASTMSEQDRTRVAEVRDLILPVSRRIDGIMNDGLNVEAMERYPLEQIRAPTLVVDAEDESTFPGSKYTAEHIPGAQLVAFPTGGHLLIGHAEQARTAIAGFLRSHR